MTICATAKIAWGRGALKCTPQTPTQPTLVSLLNEDNSEAEVQKAEPGIEDEVTEPNCVNIEGQEVQKAPRDR